MYKQREIDDNERNCLDLIEEQLTEDITNYEITKTEDIFDDEEDIVYRAFYFNRGTETYQIAISPNAEIKGCRIDIPSLLILDIANSLIGILNNIISEIK